MRYVRTDPMRITTAGLALLERPLPPPIYSWEARGPLPVLSSWEAGQQACAQARRVQAKEER